MGRPFLFQPSFRRIHFLGLNVPVKYPCPCLSYHARQRLAMEKPTLCRNPFFQLRAHQPLHQLEMSETSMLNPERHPDPASLPVTGLKIGHYVI